MNRNPEVFACFAKEDTGLMLSWVERLWAGGAAVWSGAEGEDDAAAMQAAKVALIFATRHAFTSPKVLNQIVRALTAGKPLLVVHFEPVSAPENLAAHLAQHPQVQAHGPAGRLAWQTVIEMLRSHGISWQAQQPQSASQPGGEASALSADTAGREMRPGALQPAAASLGRPMDPSQPPLSHPHMVDPRENPGIKPAVYLGILAAIIGIVGGLWVFLGRDGGSIAVPAPSPAPQPSPGASPAESAAREVIMHSLDWRCSNTQLDAAALASLYSDPVTYDGELVPRSELATRIGELAASSRREFKLEGPVSFREGPLPGLIVAEADVSVLVSDGEDVKPDLLRYTYTIKTAGKASEITEVKIAEIKP